MPLIPTQEPPYYELSDTPDANGLKQYTGNLTEQSSTNPPILTILYNTIGTIVWTRDSTGYYKGTLSGAFPENKTWSVINGIGAVDPKILQLVWESENVIALYCYTDNTLGTLVDISVSGAIIPLIIKTY